jgi:hypothetical protein
LVELDGEAKPSPHSCGKAESKGVASEDGYVRWSCGGGVKMNINQAKELPIYLTLKEVAELLKVKPRTIYA